MRRLIDSGIEAGAVLAIVAAIMIAANTDFREPPRYDGAGYSVLARSILEGTGYREIDRPDSPLHAHFPPLYPVSLALLWKGTGISFPAAHGLSLVCTVAAVILAWIWMRRLVPPLDAFLLGLCLSLNWSWNRVGGAIQSEPLFLLLSLVVVLIADGSERDRLRRGLLIGLAAGLATLTRHVGACLVAALILNAVLAKRPREAVGILVAAGLVVAPWAGWIVSVGRPNQAGLFEGSGLAERVREQFFFYMYRIPDLIVGPFVESATVFGVDGRKRLAATIWAGMATATVVLGWRRLVAEERGRLAALIPALTFPLLWVWPFTEAGRFLIPLLPVLLLGLNQGLAGLRRPAWALPALVLLALTVPYSAYSIARGRAAAQRATHADFDAACAWIKANGTKPGLVISRHPGEVFLQTGRKAVNHAWSDQPVAYLLDDGERFAGASMSAAEAVSKLAADRVKLVRDGKTKIYEVTP